MEFLPIRRMRDRIEIDRQESDTAAYLTLLYFGELLIKTITAGVVAAVQDDRDRHRYRHAHRLVRADGLGDWPAVIRDVLIGPASQFLDPEARAERNEVTQRCSQGSWQFEAAHFLHGCLQKMDVLTDRLPGKVSCMNWFDLFVLLRNKTKGHGAKRTSALGTACCELEKSLNLIADNLYLFKRPCAYLKRNFSGKYRVTCLGGDRACFEDLTRRADVRVDDGVYLFFSHLRRVELMHSDPDVTDFLFPNGGFNDTRYELLSYITGDAQFAESGPYLAPAGTLPGSETEGLGNLDLQGNCFGNLPPDTPDYVPRRDLQSQLKELLLADRHEIVSLTGPGGIGKTWLAIRVLHEITRLPNPRYQVLVWFSARDIDLLPQGPKTVTPRGITIRDFAQLYVSLIGPEASKVAGFNPIEHLSQQMTNSAVGPTLFVFDNFETVSNAGEVYHWIDTYIRPPNKALITTRVRGPFAGDYPLQVRGMAHDECLALIRNVASALGIVHLLSDEYCQELIEESDGHPYVVKVLLGEMKKAGTRRKIERIVATRDDVLTALFERTYTGLSPAAQRVFLTLSNWRSIVLKVALEAILLRASNEKTDVEAAIDELLQSSLIEEVQSPEQDLFLNVPLAASLFGQRKLCASAWRASVEADTELLRGFRAVQKVDIRHGAIPRVAEFFKSVAAAVARGSRNLLEVASVLEFICRRYPECWLTFADLFQEVGLGDWVAEIRRCLQQYLEARPNAPGVSLVWKRLADMCRETNDLKGELHALAAMCQVPGLPASVLASAANRVNSRLSSLTSEQRESLPKEEKQILIRDVAAAIERRIDELDGIGCSRLAWLFLHLGQERRARQVAQRGLQVDPDNLHCQGLLEKVRSGATP